MLGFNEVNLPFVYCLADIGFNVLLNSLNEKSIIILLDPKFKLALLSGDNLVQSHYDQFQKLGLIVMNYCEIYVSTVDVSSIEGGGDSALLKEIQEVGQVAEVEC